MILQDIFIERYFMLSWPLARINHMHLLAARDLLMAQMQNFTYENIHILSQCWCTNYKLAFISGFRYLW